MSIHTERDPRTVLVREKYFSLRPKPLERWLWQQGLPQAAERIFWLHWEIGMRNGDWCSELPLKRVAYECAVDPSTVTRAYQLLKSKGLIRREDPGRDPNNPFCQATAVTEVRLPREFLTELGRSPNRPARPAEARPAEARPAEAPPLTVPRAAVPPSAAPTLPASPARRSREQIQELWGRASAAERTRYFAASRDRLTGFEFDPHTQLTPEDRGYLLAELAQLAAARPAPAARTGHCRPPEPAGPRRLSVLEMARARRQVLETVPATDGDEFLRQVIWAVEEGALRRFAVSLALNIALKKIREGAWSRPHRMPPNWHPAGKGAAVTGPRPAHAAPEQCSAA